MEPMLKKPTTNDQGLILEEPALLELDSRLHEQVSGISILDAVKPLNYHEQKKQFIHCLYSIEPEFIYQQHTIDTFSVKRELFQLPIDQVKDDDLKTLYQAVVDSYVDKIDQFKSIGSSDFLYDSLRYYGEPSSKDIRNAHFVLHLPASDEPYDDVLLGSSDIAAILTEFADKEGYEYQLRVDDTMIANALASGKTIKVNRSARINKTEAMALAHHELGVHLVTTLNARSQPLKVLSLGCPVNTTTQEGMAILSEYLSGHMPTKRLRTLALRVLAVESMIKEKNFRRTFLLLKEEHKVEEEEAFDITARAFRGGGLTKDYLYLQGFHQILNAYEQASDFNNLLIGKTSLAFLPLITRLIEKQLLIGPQRLPPAFSNPVDNDDILQFVVHAIK